MKRLIGIALLAVGAAMGTAWGGTLYWGGGTTDKANGTALPTTFASLAGTWDVSAKNWAADTNGTTYQAWSNTGTNMAIVGQGVTSFVANNPTITFGTDITANRLEVFDQEKSSGAKLYCSGSGATLTLSGTTPMNINAAGYAYDPGNSFPKINVMGYGPGGFTCIFQPGLKLVGTNGLIWTGHDGTFQGDASGLTGPIVIRGLTGPTVTFDASSSFQLGATNIQHLGAMIVFKSKAGPNTAFSDNLMINDIDSPFMDLNVSAGNKTWYDDYNSGLGFQGDRTSGNPSTETIRQVRLASGYGSIDLSTSAAGSGTPNGKFILGDAAAGLDRGPDGKGMLFLKTTDAANTIRTDLIVSNGAPTNAILPWAITSYGRLVQLDGNYALQGVMNTDAPNDVSTWVADSDYRITNTLTGTLGNLTLSSLTAYQVNPVTSATLTQGAGTTLSLRRGILGVAGGSGSFTFTLASGGYLTTTNTTLYINAGAQTFGLSWGMIKLNGSITGAFDVVYGIGSGNEGGDIQILGTATDKNTYSGTTYFTGASAYYILKRPSGSAAGSAVPGNMVIEGGIVEDNGIANNQIATNANVTIRQYGTLLLPDGQYQTIGGTLTLEGGTIWQGGTGNAILQGAGTGLAFNGGAIIHNFNYTSKQSVYLLTDVSYASSSTMPARWRTDANTVSYAGDLPWQNIFLSTNAAGSVSRTFNIAKSSSLPAGQPEMECNYCIADSAVGGGGQIVGGPGKIIKTGTGALRLCALSGAVNTDERSGRGPWVGGIDVNGGTLIADSFGFSGVRTGEVDKMSAVVTGLPRTDDLFVGQEVISAGWLNGNARIASIDSASQITLNSPVGAKNSIGHATIPITFTGQGALGVATNITCTMTSGSRGITGLSSTNGLCVGQTFRDADGSGAAIQANTYIMSIDSSSQITVSKTASSSITKSLSFYACSASGTGPVTVNNGGTLMGFGVAGVVTNNSGGTIDPGTVSGGVGTLAFGNNVIFNSGSTLHVDVASGTSYDTLQVYGNVWITNNCTLTVTALNNYKLTDTDSMPIIQATGIINGNFTTVPAGYKVKASGNQLLLTRQPSGFIFCAF